MYSSSPYPTYDEKAKIAELIGLDLTTVENWFHHRRKFENSTVLFKSTKLASGEIVLFCKIYSLNDIFSYI